MASALTKLLPGQEQREGTFLPAPTALASWPALPKSKKLVREPLEADQTESSAGMVFRAAKQMASRLDTTPTSDSRTSKGGTGSPRQGEQS